MVFYGLGTIVGAGIYVLIGEIAGYAGSWAPLSFLAAALIASFTGLSYAELVGRYPRSAGEAVYVHAAFNQKWLSQLMGWAVVLTGLVSAATLLKGFSAYYINLFGGSSALVIIVAVFCIGLLACSGVKQSVGVAVVITIIELLGLLLVILASADALSMQTNWQKWQDGLSSPSWVGISAAAFLAFYAFIGFEDMVNMAEEVKDAERVLPKAIIIAVIVATLIYFIIAIVAVVVMPPEQLAKSQAPMAAIAEQSSWFPAPLLTLISLVAILNGAIVQLLMAPRVIYGLTSSSVRLQFLAKINPKTQTPLNATVVVCLFILLFALALPLARLAQLTSAIILIIFVVVNAALLLVKQREPYGGFMVPACIPVLGMLTSSILFAGQFFI
jgi:amino acid transporter